MSTTHTSCTSPDTGAQRSVQLNPTSLTLQKATPGPSDPPKRRAKTSSDLRPKDPQTALSNFVLPAPAPRAHDVQNDRRPAASGLDSYDGFPHTQVTVSQRSLGRHTPSKEYAMPLARQMTRKLQTRNWNGGKTEASRTRAPASLRAPLEGPMKQA